MKRKLALWVSKLITYDFSDDFDKDLFFNKIISEFYEGCISSHDFLNGLLNPENKDVFIQELVSRFSEKNQSSLLKASH